MFWRAPARLQQRPPAYLEATWKVPNLMKRGTLQAELRLMWTLPRQPGSSQQPARQRWGPLNPYWTGPYQCHF